MISGGDLNGIKQKLCDAYAEAEKEQCRSLVGNAWEDGCKEELAVDQEGCVESYLQREMSQVAAKNAAPKIVEPVGDCDPTSQTCGPKETVAAAQPAAAPAAPKPAAPKAAAAPAAPAVNDDALILALAQKSCGENAACRAELDQLVNGLREACNKANKQTASQKECVTKRLKNPGAAPTRKFAHNGYTLSFKEYVDALPTRFPPTSGRTGLALRQTGSGGGGSTEGVLQPPPPPVPAPEDVAAAEHPHEQGHSHEHEAPVGATAAQVAADAPAAGTASTTTGTAGDLAISVAEYNSDGLRDVPSFLREAQGSTDYLPHGSVTANVEPSSETFGFLTAAEAEGKIVNDPDYSVGYGLAASLWQWPNLNALYSGDSALRKGWYPKGTEDADGQWSDFQLYVYFEKPLGGRYGIALPEVNLVAANEKALEIEKKCEDRWGKEAAAVYLDSVLRKQMGNATGTTEDFNARWNSAVTIGAKKYEEMLNGGALPKGGTENLATQIQLADLFQYNPMGLVDFIAVWSGKTPEEVKEKLASVDWNAIHSNKGADRVPNVRSILTAANAAGLSKEYKFPDKYEENGKVEETPLPDSSDIRANYKRKMNEVLGQIAEGSNMKEKDLREAATVERLNLDGPPNPWAAQRVVGELIDKVAKKKYGDKAPVTLRMDLGNVDRNHDYPGFGAKLSVKWNPIDVLELGGWVFAGAARSNPIDTTSDGPSFAFMDIKDQSGKEQSDDGWTAAGGASVKWSIYQTKNQRVRELGLKASAYYTGGGDEGTPSAESHLAWKIGPNVTFAPFRGVNFRTEHSFHYEGRLKWGTSYGDVLRNFFVVSPVKARFGDHFYVRPFDYIYQNGTRGGGDFATLETNNPWGGPASGTTPPSSTERTLDLGQTGHFLKGVVGWEFETDKFIEAGYSLLVYNDLTKINDERISNGSLDRFTVYLGVKVPF